MRTHRPRQSAAQWASIIDQFNRSDLTVEAFCEQRNIAKSTFCKWKHKFRTQPNSSSTAIATVPAFKEVQPIKQKTDEESASLTSVVTLKLGAGVILTIHSGIAPS